jgi:hypothetical protein
MHSVQSQISIPASINDTARTLYINFTDGGDPYSISEGCTALLIISKPSGAKLSEWCAIKDNTNVIYPFSQNKNTASEEGICECEITLYSAPDEDGDIEQIASPRFSIVVSERAINRGDDEVLPEASIGFIDQAARDELVRRQKEQERQTAENARVSAEVARAGAETARANAESARATAEPERASAESARKTAENARASAETARASAESARATAEAERQRNAAEYKAQVDLVREEIETWQDEWGKISSFDKRIENLEAAVSPGLVTPTVDSTVAYSKTVPKGVLPNAAVCEVGGMSYKCENLLDMSALDSKTISGVTFTKNSNGTYTASGTSTAAISVALHSIGIANTEKMWLSGGTRSVMLTANAMLNNAFVQSLVTVQGTTSAVPQNITYDKIALYLVINKGVTLTNETFYGMLNKGTTALPYQPYFTGLRDSKVTAVESESANVYCGTKSTNDSGSGITYEWNKDEQIITITASTSAAAEVFLSLEEALNIVGGEAYSISAVILADTSTVNWSIGACDSRNKYNVAGGYSCLARITSPRTYTFANDACLDMIHIFVNGSGTVKTKFKYMINKGSTALPYSPYFRETLTMPADALDGFGQGVNAQYYNKIVLDPLVGAKKYVKMVKKIELNGTESMSAQNHMAHFTVQQFNISGPSDIKNGIDVLCNEATSGWNAFTGNANEIGVSSGYIVIGIPKALLTPYGYVDGTSSTYVSSFKAYLKAKYDNGTPITVAYAIATPVETDVSTLFADDNLLPVETGGTITAVNEYEQAVPTSIEYTVKGA